ncbi:MAG: rhodanese-like domain-containing protein [Ignavibacteriales bacterium]|nr:rhodanese-like domain-containing protein [Ignavibacteriales bacterium]
MKKFLENLTTNQKLGGVALVLGFIALFAGDPYGGTSIKVNEKDLALSTVGNADKISVNDLADWIIKDKADFELVDLRSEEKFNEYSIPNSQCIPLTQLSSSELLRNQKIILFSDDDVASSQAWFILKSKNYKGVYILDGGLDAWKEKVLFPKAPVNGIKDELDQFEKMKEVAKYFGGSVQTDSSITETKTQIKLPTSKSSNTKTTAPTGKKKKREGC